MSRTLHTAAILAALLSIGGLASSPLRADDLTQSKDKCVACHANPEYLVTNKKLYDYFQNWRSSVHGLEGVTCIDCHGGRADLADKEAAHASMLAADQLGDAVSYRHVPATCGACHQEQLKAYQTSRHYQLMKTREQAERGPNCVTCHGSVSAAAPTVRTVAQTCAQCHNTATGNHPDTPARAEKLLNDYNAIRGFRLFVSRRGEGELRDQALRRLDAGLDDLTRHWHTFDLESIAVSTDKLLTLAKAQYNAVREARQATKSGR